VSTQAQDLTVRKSLVVDCSPEQAFETFTARIYTWWPFETHSPADERPEDAVFDPREGGRVYDRMASGEEHEWAKVLVWEPPHRFVIDWHVNPENPSTELEVRFTPEGDGTRLDLEHRGWERYGEQANESFASYDSGWDVVLRPFVKAASS
jgi:Activator of Hsp90 ATPase homolog 1-like protein